MSERPTRASETAAPLRAGVRLQTRGVVQPGALYITRRIDEILAATLRAGRWAVVLGPRFSGKSSLRARTVQTLQATEAESPTDADTAASTYRCATIEARSLTAAGAGYLALCNTIASELRLTGVNTFWQRHSDETPVARFQRYLRQEVVTETTRTVILIDDLDALQRLPLDLPELLAAFGQVRDTLLTKGNAGQLTLVFFSTVEPERLAATPAGQTLWGAERFLVPDFTRPQMAAFGPALAALVRDAEPAFVQSWIDAVFDWTGGHPQLTQHLCQQLVARAPSSGGAAGTGSEGLSEPSARVERLVHRLFLDQEDAIEQDPCLREMALALSRSSQAAALIALYRRLLSGVPVTPDALDAVQRELRLGGLATAADDPAGTPRLRPRCRLVATLLGEAWAREHEVRLILQEAIAHEAVTEPRAAAGKLLRGVPLKTAQAWARKHPEALRPPEVRVLLASLEAARSEAEAKHQASAAALQRELRDKTELRYPGGPTNAPSLVASGRMFPERSWRLAAGATITLVVCLVAAGWASAYRRATRLEQASQQAAARALRAEQAIQTLRSQLLTKSVTPAPPTGAAPTKLSSAATGIVTAPGPAHSVVTAAVVAPGTGVATVYAAGAAPTQAAIALRAALSRQPAASGRPSPAQTGGGGASARPKTPPVNGSPARHAAAPTIGSCPDPDRTAN